jgi:hypothetical protein
MPSWPSSRIWLSFLGPDVMGIVAERGVNHAPCLSELLARLPVDDLRTSESDTATTCPGTGGRPGSAPDGRSSRSASRSPVDQDAPDMRTDAPGAQHPTAAAPGRIWAPEATIQPTPGQAARRHLKPGRRLLPNLAELQAKARDHL